MQKINYERLGVHNLGSVKRYIENGIDPGFFWQSVFSNDFINVIGNADKENENMIKEIAIWLYNDCPMEAWGSRERFDKWLEKGGLYGKK